MIARASRAAAVHARRALGAVGLFAGAVAVSSSCTQETVTVPLRSLERSGRVSFVCLASPGDPTPGLPLDTCTGRLAADPDEFPVDGEGNTTLPHIYALITQTTRGEVAVVDITAETDSVIDQNERIPGPNFLPIAAQPTEIVSTPGGTATFVGVAEVGREGLFALPSAIIRPSPTRPAPSLSSWPACSLPSAPGAMVVVSDPKNAGGEVRSSCDAAYGAVPPPPEGATDLAVEDRGRQKLLVTLPDLGAFAVLDAQALLERAPGSFAPCAIERYVPLEVGAIPPPVPPGGEPGPGFACVAPPVRESSGPAALAARPSGIAVSGDRLYIGDHDAPVIHVVDLPTPCEPVERAPLLPTSAEEPGRVVTVGRLAASGLTRDLRRFLYALDVEDGSTMVFDISDGGAPRVPIVREHPEWNPFQPRDRIKFASPAHDVILVERDLPASHPATGIASTGTLCDPDPALVPCNPGAQSCDVETLYRTSVDFETGAGPLRLRGTFAFVLLASGQIAIVDVEDYDAACRGPAKESVLLGCDPPDPVQGLVTSGEVSCNVSRPHTPRDARYLLSNDVIGRNQPGLQLYPSLQDRIGTTVPRTDPAAPVMRATVPPADGIIAPELFNLSVGGTIDIITPRAIPEDQLNGLARRWPPHVRPEIGDGGIIIGVDDLPRHAVAMNLEDPRAQLFEQTFTVTFEGSIPGFEGRSASLDILSETTAQGLYDVSGSSAFCDRGVQSENMVRDELAADGLSAAAIDARAPGLADVVQIANDIPPEGDLHWDTFATGCSPQVCRNVFGTAELPRVDRDIRIVEAYQDHLVLADTQIPRRDETGALPPDWTSAVDDELVKCCFPTLIQFRVRPRSQWVVIGTAVGFLHHVVPDESDEGGGVCRNSCDPAKQRLNGRVREAPPGTVVRDDDPAYAFINPMFRFAINRGTAASDRDDFFTLITQGAFSSLVIGLSSETQDILPQAITFLSPTGELAVTDGSLEGLILVSPASLDVERQFF